MRGILDARSDHIAALVMLAGFDSAARSDERAQPFLVILTSCPV